MRIDRVLLAAPRSGSGKTVITCGILAALKSRGLVPSAFKCGPDYIDPMFHRRALGIKSSNLDSFFLEREALKAVFAKQAAGSDVAVIEGAMGYYDGLGGTSFKASAYEVGRWTKAPAVLIVDGKGASRSLAALIQGFVNYVPDSGIRAVIFNRMNPMVCRKLTPFLEALGVSVLGCVPEEEVFHLESRHLGLAFPGSGPENGEEAMSRRLAAMGRRIAETVDLDGLMKLAAEAPEWEILSSDSVKIGKRENVSIGLAMDEAFCFYYEENLKLMESLGAKLVPFSPLRDGELPPGLDGLLLGGGYPELWAKTLSENVSMRASVLDALKKGMPALAECGGFLYLHRQLEGADGSVYPMVGALDADAFRLGRLSRFGYVNLRTENGMTLRGHEFHYWESRDPGDRWTAEKPESERRWSCVHEKNGGYWGFPHIYYASNPQWLEGWLDRCLEYRRQRMEKP